MAYAVPELEVNMSKIICDVCGTTYPETASQCPICGCAKSADSRTVTGDKVSTEAESSYQFVKGGRFSKKNVNKRNQQNLVRQEKAKTVAEDVAEEEEGSNKGLIIVMLLLLAVIIAVVIYIAVRFFAPAPNGPGPLPSGNPDPTPGTSTAAPTDPTQTPTAKPTEAPTSKPTEAPTSKPTDAPTEAPTHPCTGLSLQNVQILLEQPGSTAKIDVTVDPADTTDELLFTSDNDEVATVDENGTVTAVGEGTARITITCGSFQVHCDVEVVYPTTEPTEPPTEEPTEPASELELNRSDITFFSEGESWDVYSGSVSRSEITWSSNNEDVATVENGVVTAVGPGVTTIYADYEGEEVSCIIRCNWTEEEEPTEEEEEPTEPEEEPTEPEEETTEPEYDPDETYTISHTDVSIFVGESFYLTLTDSEGNEVDVTWYASDDGYVSISGNRITGESTINSSSFYVYTTVNGTAYYCVVRVR